MTCLLYQGHGSYRMTLEDGTVIYVDPYVGAGYDLPADLILVSHEHFDHNHIDMMPHSQDCTIIRHGDVHPSHGRYLTLESHGVRITGVQACNANHPIDDCVGFVLEMDGLSVYAAGDTSMTDDMRTGKLEALGLDYAILPCDGRFNMDVDEASECAKLIDARHSIPVHLTIPKDQDDTRHFFDAQVAKRFKARGRIIAEPGQLIEL